ncbi:unnamed protein product, partial [Ectocarpus fasciculatus]
MKHATVATTALAVPCWLLSSSCSVVVAWTTTPSSRRCFQTSASLQCRQSSARPLARTSSSHSSSDNGYGYGVRGGGSATSCQSLGRLGQRVQGLPWLRQSPSRLCSTAPTGAESDDSGDKSGGVPGASEGAGMGESEPRQGADLKTQIGLFVEMSTPFFKEDNGARWLLATVVALTLLNSGVSVAFSYIGRDFWTALSNKDPAQFNIMLQRFLAALVAGVPVTVFYRFEREKLALAWREWMTKRVMEIYYSGQTYYALEASKEIDNPDQRIAEDVRAFTQVSLEFLITVLTSCIDLASFSTILYSIYPQLFIA